jgi:Mg2+/Co2+ transporter CorC
MSETEPPSSDGQSEHRSLARLRNLLRHIWRTRDPRETIDAMIAEEPGDDEESPITPQERVLIGNVLKVHDRTAADVMVPRVDVVAFDIDRPFPELVKLLIEHGHSRVPVYRETLDDVLGSRRCCARCLLLPRRCRCSISSSRCARPAPTSRWSSTSSAVSMGW